jgi:hypothetical protein
MSSPHPGFAIYLFISTLMGAIVALYNLELVMVYRKINGIPSTWLVR